jgi:hypothetical protein
MPEGSVPVSASMTDALGNGATVSGSAIKDTTPEVILVSDFNPAAKGQTVTLTATLSDYSQIHLPTGSVVFKTGGTPIPGCESRPIVAPGVYALCFLPATTGGTWLKYRHAARFVGGAAQCSRIQTKSAGARSRRSEDSARKYSFARRRSEGDEGRACG